MRRADLVFHPLRSRIIVAFAGQKELSTKQICKLFPNESRATLYRHIAALQEGGILEVTELRAVRGAIERIFRLVDNLSLIHI